MSEELDSFQLQGEKKLPNESAVLVLGILSLISCLFYGVIGLVLGIIALSLHKKDKEIYNANPNGYERSFKNSNAGKICAIVGVSLSSLFILFMIITLGAVFLIEV